MRRRGNISLKLVAQLMVKAGFNHIITVDMHSKESQGFFDCAIDNLRASPFLIQYIQEFVSFILSMYLGKMISERSAIVGKLLAQMMVMSGFKHIITMDLHQKELQGFFDCPVDNLRASPFLINYIQQKVSFLKFSAHWSKKITIWSHKQIIIFTFLPFSSLMNSSKVSHTVERTSPNETKSGEEVYFDENETKNDVLPSVST